MEIPLADFKLTGPIRQLRFIGDLRGTFYLDDLRFKLAPGHGPVAALWEHDLPDTLIASSTELAVEATVRLTRFEADGPPPQVRADLSALGGAAALPLTAVNRETYRLDTRLDLEGVAPGRHRLWVRVEQTTSGGRHWQRLWHPIFLQLPDLTILDEALAQGWRLIGGAGAQVLGLVADGPVFNGAAAMAVQAQAENFFTPWSIELWPPEPVARGGRTGQTRPGRLGKRPACPAQRSNDNLRVITAPPARRRYR